jgi:plastocyanin
MARRSRSLSVVIIGLLAAGLLLLQASVVLAAGASVTINNYKFTPKSIAVKPGTTITWHNKQDDDDHTVTADDGSFDTGVIKHAGGSASLTFDTEGTFAYHCTIHSFMHGTVVVSANAVEAPATDATDFSRGEGGTGVPLPVLLTLVGIGFLALAGSLAFQRSAAADRR